MLAIVSYAQQDGGVRLMVNENGDLMLCSGDGCASNVRDAGAADVVDEVAAAALGVVPGNGSIKELTSYTQSEYRKAFDENDNLITREVSSDSWEPLLGGGNLLEKIITTGSKRALPIDVQLKMRTVSEEVRFDLWQRDVKAEALYIDGSKIPIIEPYHYGPWNNTGTSDWLPSGYEPSTYPVGGRICPILCGAN